jgi:hypothetical protein
MPEDMRELFRQRQRELAAERAQLAANAKTEGGDESTLTVTDTEPKLEQVTLPPPPKTEDQPVVAPAKPETAAPKAEPPPPTTRPREVEPQKKKGKKGEDEP